MNAGDSDVTPFVVLVYKKYQISKEYDQRVFLGSFVLKKKLDIVPQLENADLLPCDSCLQMV